MSSVVVDVTMDECTLCTVCIHPKCNRSLSEVFRFGKILSEHTFELSVIQTTHNLYIQHAMP